MTQRPMSGTGGKAMKTVTYEYLRKVGRSVQGVKINRFQSNADRQRAGASHERTCTSAVLICGVVISLLPLSTVGGQSKPKAPDSRTTAPTEALAAEHSSPNADYAIDSLLSRTAAPSNGDNTDDNVSDILARRLWKNRKSAPDPDEDADTRRALQNLIGRVQSIRFAGSDTEPTFSAPAPTADTPSAAQSAIVNAGPQIAAPLPNTAVPARESPPALEPATLERLESLLQDPNQVSDPLDMAELLFLSGHPMKAAIFYEKALSHLKSGDPDQSEDRAWILFQLGNCLRETDMSRAKDVYMKLIAQHPSSPWTELAKAHGRLITWYQGTNPQQWMPTKESP